jgi:hypothetical protein
MTYLAIRSMKAAPLAGQRVAVGDPPPEVPQARPSAPTLVETLARPNAVDERIDQDDATYYSRKGCELPHGHSLRAPSGDAGRLRSIWPSTWRDEGDRSQRGQHHSRDPGQQDQRGLRESSDQEHKRRSGDDPGGHIDDVGRWRGFHQTGEGRQGLSRRSLRGAGGVSSPTFGNRASSRTT